MAPAPIEEGCLSAPVVGEMGPDCVEKSRELAFWFEDVAVRTGCCFLDAGSIDEVRARMK